MSATTTPRDLFNTHSFSPLVFDDSLNPSFFETKKTEDRPLVSAYRDEIR
jgi:hypothetical protein